MPKSTRSAVATTQSTTTTKSPNCFRFTGNELISGEGDDAITLSLNRKLGVLNVGGEDIKLRAFHAPNRAIANFAFPDGVELSGGFNCINVDDSDVAWLSKQSQRVPKLSIVRK